MTLTDLVADCISALTNYLLDCIVLYLLTMVVGLVSLEQTQDHDDLR
jgi:hypothetical protein